jgi:hypothetical protein
VYLPWSSIPLLPRLAVVAPAVPLVERNVVVSVQAAA